MLFQFSKMQNELRSPYELPYMIGTKYYDIIPSTVTISDNHHLNDEETEALEMYAKELEVDIDQRLRRMKALAEQIEYCQERIKSCDQKIKEDL